MSLPRFDIVELSAAHVSAAFDCGNEEMNAYARTRMRSEHASRVTGVFVLVSEDDPAVHGFYTLSPTEIKTAQAVSAGIVETHPYARIGGVLLGRLGIATTLQDKGFGTLLVTDAIRRSLANPMRPTCMVVDPKDEGLCIWYAHRWGFLRLTPGSRRMVLRFI